MKKLLILFAALLFTGSVNAATANLAWDASPTLNVQYHIYQSVGTNPFSLVLTTASTSATVTFTASTRYYVTAFNTNGESGPSNTLTVVPPASPPAPPTNLRATAISASRIDLQWDPLDPNIFAVFVERNNIQTAVVPRAQMYYLDTQLRKGRVYVYRVRGRTDSGLFTGYSNTASAQTLKH